MAAYRLPGGVAAAAATSQPLLVVLFSWAILTEKPSKFANVAAIAGFIGGFVLLGVDESCRCDADWIRWVTPNLYADSTGRNGDRADECFNWTALESSTNASRQPSQREVIQIISVFIFTEWWR